VGGGEVCIVCGEYRLLTVGQVIVLTKIKSYNKIKKKKNQSKHGKKGILIVKRTYFINSHYLLREINYLTYCM